MPFARVVFWAAIYTSRSVSDQPQRAPGPPLTEGRPGPRAQRMSMKPALSPSHGSARAQPTPDPRNPACQGPRGAVGPSSWGAGVLQLAVAGLPGKAGAPQAASRMPAATPTVTVGKEGAFWVITWSSGSSRFGS